MSKSEIDFDDVIVLLNKEEEIYVATCVELGTVSQGSSIEEALQNLKEATELYLEEFPQTNFPTTFITTFTTEEYA